MSGKPERGLERQSWRDSEVVKGIVQAAMDWRAWNGWDCPGSFAQARIILGGFRYGLAGTAVIHFVKGRPDWFGRCSSGVVKDRQYWNGSVWVRPVLPGKAKCVWDRPAPSGHGRRRKECLGSLGMVWQAW